MTRTKTARRHKGSIRKGPKRSSRTVRVHQVNALLTVGELAKAGSALRLQVFGAGGKIGQLEIGRGSLFWKGKNRWGKKRLRWPDFAAAMNDLAYGRQRS